MERVSTLERKANSAMAIEARSEEKDSPFERQFRLLETVAAFPRGLTLSELVTVMDLPKTTVHRLLQGLTRAGVLLSKNARFGPYVLGPRFLGLLHSSVPDDWTERLAKPILQELVDKTGDTCFLARLSGDHIRSVVMATPENDVHVYVVPGRELAPLFAASAKAILAFQDRSVVQAVIAAASNKSRLTANQLKHFEAELQEVAARGVAYNAGEDIAGYAAVASPVRLQGSVQYSVAVTGTYEKLMAPEHKEYLSNLTRTFAKRLGETIEIRFSQTAAQI